MKQLILGMIYKVIVIFPIKQPIIYLESLKYQLVLLVIIKLCEDFYFFSSTLINPISSPRCKKKEEIKDYNESKVFDPFSELGRPIYISKNLYEKKRGTSILKNI